MVNDGCHPDHYEDKVGYRGREEEERELKKAVGEGRRSSCETPDNKESVFRGE